MDDLDLLLGALAHPTRRTALRLLRCRDELCLCELISAIGVSQSTMSRHMATLKEAGLVTDRRDAQWVRYRLNLNLRPEWAAIVETVMATTAMPVSQMEEVA